MRCLLTVGSTQFQDLVDAFLAKETLGALEKIGISHVDAQIGTSRLNNTQDLPPTVSTFKYSDNIDALIEAADIVVSHAGSGSVLSFARGTSANSHRLIIVPNDRLMDSHQSDLAHACSSQGWALVARPTASSLVSALESAAQHRSTPWPQQNADILNSVLAEL